MKLTIPFTLPGLNDYISAERIHRQRAAALKRKCELAVRTAIASQIKEPLFEPVVMHYTWVEKDKRRDKDNISSFGRKVIQDALVKAGYLENDGWSNIAGFSDGFEVDKENPRVEIEIIEGFEV